MEPETPLVEVELERVAHGGQMISHLDGEIVFVPYGLPGERASARLSTPHSNSAEREARLRTARTYSVFR